MLDKAAPPPAETAQPAPDTQPATAQAAPTPETQPATATAQPTPSQPAAPAQPATAAAQPAAPAPGQPATDATQVAQVVSQEFGTYDKDASGALDKTEFGTWMAALRKASQPTFQPDSAEARTWVAQAFTQADTDKNAAVSQAELTTFLSPKPA